ncbi:hypothetical protein EV401DRAFT_1911687 [Pisolithus croceorrhizus]|nr:hypothetical protein EV401DRAFT_1911687 [Pisolithus croceorrhizus]
MLLMERSPWARPKSTESTTSLCDRDRPHGAIQEIIERCKHCSLFIEGVFDIDRVSGPSLKADLGGTGGPIIQVHHSDCRRNREFYQDHKVGTYLRQQWFLTRRVLGHHLQHPTDQSYAPLPLVPNEGSCQPGFVTGHSESMRAVINEVNSSFRNTAIAGDLPVSGVYIIFLLKSFWLSNTREDFIFSAFAYRTSCLHSRRNGSCASSRHMGWTRTISSSIDH